MIPETPVAHPIDASAPAVVRLPTTVHASLTHVWALHTHVAARPERNWRRIVRGDPAHGIDGIHAWTFEKRSKTRAERPS
ncbi:hypothetical protein [Streptomyces sp. NPDC029674]|uniref:hypothetical protein n=1 Tax=Streptomyces sp. NPDC029674 TaxID=3365297 RepID=UPI00384D86CC